MACEKGNSTTRRGRLARHLGTALLVCGATTAWAGETVIGSSRAQQCYDYALMGGAPMKAAGVCSDAIDRDALSTRDLAATYSNRGLVYAHRDRYELALSDHTRALEIEPLNVYVLINRANTLTRMGRFEDALRDYEMADFYAQGRNPLVYYNRSLTYEKMGRKADAREDLLRAVQLKPDSRRYREALATLE